MHYNHAIIIKVNKYLTYINSKKYRQILYIYRQIDRFQCDRFICVLSQNKIKIDRQIDREIDIQKDRQIARQTDRQIDKQIERLIDIHIDYRQIDRKIDKQKDRQIGR